MQLNKFFFPKPKPNYSDVSIALLPNTELIYVSSNESTQLFDNVTFCCKLS